MKKIILILAALNTTACGMCGEDKLEEAYSPNIMYVATVFAGGCGALSGISYHVNVRYSITPFSPAYSGAIEDGQLFTTEEGMLDVSWKDDHTLIIDCEGCPAYKQRGQKMNKWRDIDIEYRFRERKAPDSSSNSSRRWKLGFIISPGLNPLWASGGFGL